MTELFFGGAEGKDSILDGLGSFGTGVTIETTIIRSGIASYKWSESGGAGGGFTFGFTGATGRTYYVCKHIYIATLPTTEDLYVLAISTAGSVDLVTVRLKPNGTIYLYDDINGAQVGSASGALSLNTWYRIELACKIGASSNDDYGECLLNGASVASSTTLNLGTTAPGQIAYTNVTVSGGSDTFTIYDDDLFLNDSQGSVNNSWPGGRKVICLLPISDNARGTNWVTGTGSTSNLYAEIANRPPLGTASSNTTTTPSKIKNAASDTTGNYDANMTSYTTGGIGASDIINAVRGVFDLGCSSATSTSGAVEVLSNPAEGGETGVNFSSGAIAGTWPSNWRQQINSLIETPTVTKGTSPVLRVGKRQATTRVGMCDFMGLMVDYTPVVSTTLFRRTDSDRIGSRS